jgi:hypothetical protein
MLCIAILMSGCADNAVLDLAPLQDFMDLRVVNDTDKTVTIADCWGACQRNGGDFEDKLLPYHEREEAAWNNATPGVAAVRVSRGGATVGCFRVRYRKEQQQAVARISEVKPCSS